MREMLLEAAVTAKGKGMTVVIFEPAALGAASALLIYIAASVSIALTHRPPDRGRDVP